MNTNTTAAELFEAAAAVLRKHDIPPAAIYAHVQVSQAWGDEQTRVTLVRELNKAVGLDCEYVDHSSTGAPAERPYHYRGLPDGARVSFFTGGLCKPVSLVKLVSLVKKPKVLPDPPAQIVITIPGHVSLVKTYVPSNVYINR